MNYDSIAKKNVFKVNWYRFDKTKRNELIIYNESNKSTTNVYIETIDSNLKQRYSVIIEKIEKYNYYILRKDELLNNNGDSYSGEINTLLVRFYDTYEIHKTDSHLNWYLDSVTLPNKITNIYNLLFLKGK